jgi:hypothetical protein
MYWNLVRQLLALDDELDTVERLRIHMPSEGLFLVDRRARLVAAMEKMFDMEEALTLDLSSNDED